MKTRIVWTRMYLEDDWFNTLSIEYKFLFIYLFTNSHIGLSGIYKLSDRVICLETGLIEKQLNKAKEKFEKDKKIFFKDEWIYIVNADKNNHYSRGEKTAPAYIKELDTIPIVIREYFNSKYTIIHYRYTIDTTINHKSETINNKSTIRNKEIREEDKHLEDVNPEDIPI